MPSITLVTQETMYHALAARALTETLKHIEVQDVLTFSDQQLLPGARNVHVDHFPSVNDYCEFMIRGICQHVTTDHILFVQWDAMAHDATQWTDEFLKYDYIGAPWPWDSEGRNIGNGGFSLRSRRLLEELQSPAIQLNNVNEDQVIGQVYRPQLESCGIKYPSTALAAQFSYELGPRVPSFGFHGPWNVIAYADLDTADYYIEQMSYAGWNIHKWHHFLSAIGDRVELHYRIPFVMQQLTQHSSELVLPVLEWLASHSTFWANAR
jgi:hypothetical protein